ncbi:EAL domain-containing protein [Pokkaliibacter sp. MBI-7]|uniref:putative bifunctional diguanylate cyclase/phosphodiesterase n=1 Tax=Pokkaliibacter sp. MBI-7 TaxID=3040600 RepID=UPI00244964B8|nr:EAL domain-containing protein [Pokkaliibacter sp. MBI-7]MDH2436240.1 EAL domain-containing protein [Pokkaliibacter sp. MBI-7]
MFNKSIRAGLLARLGISSVLFAIVVVGIQLYIATERLAATQMDLMEELLISSEKPLSEAIWSYDEVTTRKALQGLMRLDQVASVDITLANGEQYASFYKGENLMRSPLASLIFPKLMVLHRSLLAPEYSGSFRGKPIATLTIEGSNDFLFRQWLDDSLVLIVSICGLILALFAMSAIVVHRFLSRPLIALGEQLLKLDPNEKDRMFLDVPEGHDEDEIGSLVKVFNSNTIKLSLANQSMERMATRDRLTGLPNRNLALETLEQTVITARAESSQFAVYMLDVDRFKNINDTEGHERGDQLLISLTERLTSTFVTKGLFISRLGGDEFLLISELASSAERALVEAQRIIDVMREPYVINDVAMRNTVSMGVVIYPQDGENADAIMRHADLALLSSKNQGGNQVSFFTSQLTQHIHERLMLETALSRSIDLGAFELFLQPKMHAQSLEVTGCEALIRWFRDDGTMISPAVFIPIAESTRLIIGLGKWVIEEACRILQGWVAQGRVVPMAINVSVVQLLEEDFVEFVLACLRKHQVPADMLELEITESTLIDNFDKVVAVLTEVRQNGLRIAMDDFGTGYSSLSNLNRLPIDVIKADKSFVQGVPNEAAITQLIGSIGEVLGVELVAEGVETREQLEWLRQNGFDTLQGFYFSKPIPAHRFEKLFLFKDE